MKRITRFSLLTLLWALTAPVQAAMVATPHIGMESTIPQTPAVTELRQQTVQQLIERGVDADRAEHRVARMTDSQVLQLQGEIDALPAGGMSTTNLLLIIILIILIV